MIKTIFFPGTFDPLTLGHIDIIEQIRPHFDKVVMGVSAHNATKKPPLFSLAERFKFIAASFPDISKIEIASFTGLTVDAAKQHGAQCILRGIRNSTDFNYEAMLAQTNRHLSPFVTTLFVVPKPEVAHISSTLVREIAALGGDISSMVPDSILQAMQSRQ